MMTTETQVISETTQERDIRIADARRRAVRETSAPSETDVRAIRNDPRSLALIGGDFGVGKTAVARIKHRMTFAWVPDDPADVPQEPLFIDVGVPMHELDRQTAAMVLQVDARACHCGDCIVTDMSTQRDGRAVAKLHGWDVRIARVLCAIKHDLPLWSQTWECRHLCGNAACVNAAHLAPGTTEENAEDRERHGNTLRGEAHGGSNLTEVDAHRIIDTAGTLSARDAAERFGCSVRQVQSIRQGYAWAHMQAREATE